GRRGAGPRPARRPRAGAGRTPGPPADPTVRGGERGVRGVRAAKRRPGRGADGPGNADPVVRQHGQPDRGLRRLRAVARPTPHLLPRPERPPPGPPRLRPRLRAGHTVPRAHGPGGPLAGPPGPGPASQAVAVGPAAAGVRLRPV